MQYQVNKSSVFFRSSVKPTFGQSLPASKIQSNFVIQIFSQSSHIFFAEYTPIIFFLLLRLTWTKGKLQGKSMTNAHVRDWNTIEIRTGPEEMKMLEDEKGL